MVRSKAFVIMSYRNDKIKSLAIRLSAEFLARESGGQSLITVTNAQLSKSGKYVTILFTVYPPEKEAAALDFAKRQLTEFRDFFAKNSKVGNLPFFDFAIDEGEKNRQKIELLAQKL